MQKKYFKVPVQIFDDQTITANEKLLLVVLLSKADSGLTAAVSLNQLTAMSGLSKSTVQRYLDMLIGKQLVTRTRVDDPEGGHHANLYRIKV